MPGNGCVFYTATVVNSPRQIEDDIAAAARKDARAGPPGHPHGDGAGDRRGAAEARGGARRVLRQARLAHGEIRAVCSGPKAAVSEAILERAERSRGVGDPTELLLVDEVDRLKMSGLEQLRAIFDGGGIGLVLIGMPGLERRLARYAQLYSRIGFVHEFRPLGAAEVRTLLAGWRPPGVSLPEDLLADAEGGRGDHPGHRRELPAAGPAADAGRADPRAQRARGR